MRLIAVTLLVFFPMTACLAAETSEPSGDAKLIRSIAEGADHPIVFTGVVRSRTPKNETTEPYWLLKVSSVKMLMGTPRTSIDIAVPCVFYFKEGFQRVTSRLPAVYPPYSEQPQLYFVGDRVLMVAQWNGDAVSDPKGRWEVILTRFLNDHTDRLFSQDGFFMNGNAADSLAYFNQATPPDSMFCNRILQPSETTLAEVKSVLADMAATPAKKTP